ncbi:ABC transporter substrate-binding protein [Paraliomyxa miuraensis]|uniref:ABC transporter substrate-binding protein n=1 Tax=Paraliomyxa miuraensis TaxID=376150 RepID=UPI002259F506|nr:ABC transporter substrate-binding protein [Paraliomyxa miuraensis]MCX4248029.1 ABC transporter substrate-binding protein [Paraliomyxa miuraensis]
MTKHSSTGSVFKSRRYTNWPAMTDDIDAGNLKVAFILAPLAMVMKRKGTPIKIVHLGHRDGTAIVVRKDSPARDFGDLRGARIAIPHRYANQRILIERLKDQHGFADDDVTLIDFPPPEMPNGLRAGQFEAYIVGEPFAAKAEMEGFGRVLHFTKDVWPDFISCVMVVHEDLIESDPELVVELVEGIRDSGKWLDAAGEDLAVGVVHERDAPPVGSAGRADLAVIPEGFGATHRLQAATIAAREEYFSQDPELLKFVLTRPPDRVKYTDLELVREELEEIQAYAERLGFFEFRPVTEADPFGFDDYADPSLLSLGQRRPEVQHP